MQETTQNLFSEVSTELELDDAITNTAQETYEQSLDNNLHRGRDRSALQSGAIYVACRIHNEPLNATEIEEHTEHERNTILRTARALNSSLGLPIPPQNPNQYVARYADDLDLSDETEETATHLLESAEIGTGTAAGLAASALYAASTQTNEDVTQQALSNAAGVSTVTIRNWYTQLLDEQEN